MILEGTYPFISGGVSSWVHALITGMPELDFGILYLSDRYGSKESRYALPENLKLLHEVSVYDLVSVPVDTGADAGRSWQAFLEMGQQLHEGRIVDFEPLYRYLGPGGERGATIADLGASWESFQSAVELYRKEADSYSFIDFFWTWRAAFGSILQMLLVKQIPARVYHTVCTGWAGVAGVTLRRHQKRPLLLTEHGIYTNERKIDILKAEWLLSQTERSLSLKRDLGYLRRFWIQLFLALGRLCYDNCDRIYSLYGGNKELQIEYGATGENIEIIPNGVKIGRLEAPRVEKTDGEPFRVGFVGRIVPIKDVKTLILACRMVSKALPGTRFDVLGPYAEDPVYYEECLNLVRLLGLEGELTFHGRQQVVEWFPKLDVQVLTSISEGQPLVILEGYCSGLPCVATDVGSCRELIEGRTPEDRALGMAGRVTGIGAPEETGAAIVEILTQPELRRQMQEAAWERVRRYYDHDEMVATYRRVYQNFAEMPDLEFEEDG